MAERAQAKSGRGSEAGASSKDPVDVARRAAEDYRRYEDALRDAWTSEKPSEQAAQAYAAYVAAMRDEFASDRAVERNAMTARSYLRLLRSYADPEQDNMEAYRGYVQEVTDAWQPEQTRAAARKAYGDYLGALGDALAPDEIQRSADAAWQDYVKAQQELWSGLDPAAPPEIVATLAQGAHAAASLAATMRAAADQRRAARDTVTAARPD
jgi:hypothetical protein